MAITWRATPAGATPRTSTTGCARTSSDLSQPGLRRLLHIVRGDLLGASAPRPERSAPCRQLLLLRVRPSVVSHPYRDVDRHRLLRGAWDGGLARASPPVSLAERHLEFR